MERSKIYLVIFLLLLLLFLIFYIFLNTSLNKILYQPGLLKDDSSIQNTVVFDPGIRLQKCDTLGDPCIQCKDGLYSCQKVDTVLGIKDENGNTITVPPGQWCLPTVVQQEHPCNQATSTPILTKYSDGVYKWRCYCKFPNWVVSSSIDGDCDKEIACGHQDDPDNNYLVFCQAQNGDVLDPVIKNGDFTCPEGSTMIKWEPKDQIDLVKHSFCKCGPGLIYNQNVNLQVKECVKNPCDGGIIVKLEDGSIGCDCSKLKNKISCDDLPDNKRAECSIGCIDDPCKPHGTYHRELNDGKGGCVCDCEEKVGDTCVKGYMFMSDENFLANGYCEKVDDACKWITGDTLDTGDCNINRGGQCITCPVSAGYGDVKVMVPYCVNCGPDRGFMGDPVNIDDPGTFCNNKPQNCGTCGLWFTDCKGKGGDSNVDDSLYCCTGRCSSEKPFEGQCEPCNGDVKQYDDKKDDDWWNDGYISSGDNTDQRAEKQGRWDDHCNSKTGAAKPFCNSYNISWPDSGAPQGPPGWKSGDGRVGICEAEPKHSDGDPICFLTSGGVDNRRVCRYGYD